MSGKRRQPAARARGRRGGVHARKAPKAQATRLGKPWRRALVGVGALVGVLLAGALAIKPLQREVGRLRAPTQLQVEMPWPAGPDGAVWLDEAERLRLEQLVLGTVSPDPFDAQSLERARRALLETGWFASVDQVQRAPNGVVRVALTWRTPAAVVRWKGKDHLVSSDARLLPRAYPPGADGEPRVILGAGSGPPLTEEGGLAFGQRWPGGDVEAAIALLHTLRSREEAWRRIAAVDVSRWRRNGVLVMLSADGAEIVWGSVPGQEQPWERSPEEKLNDLVSLWENEDWLSRGKPRVELHRPFALVDDRPGG